MHLFAIAVFIYICYLAFKFVRWYSRSINNLFKDPAEEQRKEEVKLELRQRALQERQEELANMTTDELIASLQPEPVQKPQVHNFYSM